MNCTDVKSQLPLLPATNLEEISDPAVRAHLTGCVDCRQEWHEWQQLGTLLSSGAEPQMKIDLTALYREAGARQVRSTRYWRWLGLAASLFLALGGALALVSRVEIRVTNQEFAVRWGSPAPAPIVNSDKPPTMPAASTDPEKRGEQIEVLAATVRAMVQELQTMEMRQRRDRADLDVRVTGIQEQSLKRWIALQKDLEALYVLTQKGD
jgi:hypothetical protein